VVCTHIHIYIIKVHTKTNQAYRLFVIVDKWIRFVYVVVVRNAYMYALVMQHVGKLLWMKIRR